jgi:surfeit locus 1 family protein
MSTIKFRPNLFLTVLAIVFLGFFISLGTWQLHRSREKEQILSSLEQKLEAAPVSLQLLSKDPKQRQYQPIEFQGVFLNNKQFLLDNRIHKGKVGYEVITPVKVKGTKDLILLNRGWIPATHDRRVLPKLRSVFGLQKIHGIIRMPLAKGLVLKTEDLTDAKWPIRIQQLNFKLMAALLSKPVYPFVVLLDKNTQNGYVREWKFINMKPAKHIGYAVQWFAFALVLLIIYFALTIQREKKE